MTATGPPDLRLTSTTTTTTHLTALGHPRPGALPRAPTWGALRGPSRAPQVRAPKTVHRPRRHTLHRTKTRTRTHHSPETARTTHALYLRCPAEGAQGTAGQRAPR